MAARPRILTREDVRALPPGAPLELAAGDRLTDLARREAERRGIRVTVAGARPPAPAPGCVLLSLVTPDPEGALAAARGVLLEMGAQVVDQSVQPALGRWHVLARIRAPASSSLSRELRMRLGEALTLRAEAVVLSGPDPGPGRRTTEPEP